MNIALLGNGKTGNEVLLLAKKRGLNIEAFNRSHKPTKERLIKMDSIICFMPGDAFKEYLPLLLEVKKPCVIGSTGFKWGSSIQEQLREGQMTWIYASNFSMGMNLISSFIKKISQISLLGLPHSFFISETHHLKKLDAPSGTAKMWKNWLGDDSTQIESIRLGDVIGEHSLKIELPQEEIEIIHKATNRQLFAEGALWANDYLMSSQLDSGLYFFENVLKQELKLQ